ncbi:hypothetical protein PV325_001764 [Microctonus aethiopoides]|uniref:Ninjurin-1 n=1 Tax=Microctonus aethiopoides TaxID=144406 RepID=A0AA39FN02_9HYME|nr:hypothetical protein PV325_001764 [Microctonus aethiopoides]KAK0097663.1 hypothetical protein PV326_000345 [Microctonus aethiopoides]KAK0172607.1 hypothetical protein PV328_005905 [Microctonus aethiopoides]
MDGRYPGKISRQGTVPGHSNLGRARSLPESRTLKLELQSNKSGYETPSGSNDPKETIADVELGQGYDEPDELEEINHVPIREMPSPNSYPHRPPTPFDINLYQQKKTLAQGMMDLALISANANQMRYVLQSRDEYFYTAAMSMIIMSLVLQIIVGVGLIWNSRYNVKKLDHTRQANATNNWTVIGIFLVTILNVFISSFGVTPTDAPEKDTSHPYPQNPNDFDPAFEQNQDAKPDFTAKIA